MSITTDHSVVDLDERDRPTQVARPPRDDQPEDRRDWKQAFPARFVWIAAVATLAVAGVAAAVGFDEHATSTSANRASGSPQLEAPAQGDTGRTELDVRGVPTWWSGARPAAEHGPSIGSTPPAGIGPTELDVRGIPTWWSGERPAAEHGPSIGSTAPAATAPTVLDVRGIPTWWSGELAAVDPLEP